jgi:type I restriction enzyme S subunit
MVPEGWETASLGDCATFLSGGTPSKQRPDYWGGDLPWVSAKDLKTHRISDAQDHLTEAGSAAAKLADPDNILVLVRGMTLLKDVPIGIVTKRLAFNQDIKALVVRPNVHPQFLSYLLVGKKLQLMGLVNTANHGTGRLDTALLKSLPINLPPFPEQKKIAEILSTWDKAIETTEKLLAKAEAQKKALMQQLLTGKRRLKGFEGLEWNSGKLLDHFDFINGRAFKPDDWGGVGYPIIRIQNLTGSTDAINYFDGYVDEKHMVRDGEFLLSWSATLDTFIWRGPDAVLNQHIFKVVPRSDTLKMFGFHLITFEIDKLVSMVHGTSMKHITKKDLAKIESFFPSIPEQEKITQVLDGAQREVDVIKGDIEKLHAEKQALMQQLLTGKRRVTV